MHRIDTSTAAPGNLFTEGNPQGGIPATALSAAWFNDTVQEELVGVVLASGQALDKPRKDQLLQALDELIYGRRFRPNEVLNGAFSVWQRGLAHNLSTAEAYTADRWFARPDGAAGAGAATISRVEFSFGQTDVPGEPTHHLRFLQTVGSSIQSPRVGTRIENLRYFTGRTITVAFWARSDVTLQGTLQVDRYFGTGGSAADNVHSETFTTENVWKRHAFTIAVPAYAAQTIGSDHFLEVRIDLPGSTTFQFDLSDVLVKLGQYPASFPRVTLADEVPALLRYYEKSYAPDIAPGTINLANVASARQDVNPEAEGLLTRYRSSKGSTSVTWYSPTAGTANRVDLNGAAETVTGTTRNGPQSTGWPTISTGLGTNKLATAHWTCDSELYRI